MARASIHLMNIDKKIFNKQISRVCSHINVGSGEELSIKEVAGIIKEIVGFKGKTNFDQNKPDGSPRKLLDNERINNLGFKPEISLRQGLFKTYQNYIEFNANL
jgi:GDP-L-fucose synthase